MCWCILIKFNSVKYHLFKENKKNRRLVKKRCNYNDGQTGCRSWFFNKLCRLRHKLFFNILSYKWTQKYMQTCNGASSSRKEQKMDGSLMPSSEDGIKIHINAKIHSLIMTMTTDQTNKRTHSFTWNWDRRLPLQRFPQLLTNLWILSELTKTCLRISSLIPSNYAFFGRPLYDV